MSNYKTEAIILKRINYSEADKILTIFSKHYGKIRVLAKGVRKLTSRKGGNLELFNQVNLVLAKGKNLDIITEVEVINSFSRWRKNLIKVGTAYYFVELVDRLAAEGEGNSEIFFLLITYLSKIGKINLAQLIRSFEEEMLIKLGFGIPQSWRDKPGSLSGYIEEIIERKLKSKEVLKKIRDS